MKVLIERRETGRLIIEKYNMDRLIGKSNIGVVDGEIQYGRPQ